MRFFVVLAALTVAFVFPANAAVDNTAANYAEHCAECHGAGRLGGMGPALLPENLRRLRKSKAAGVIAAGRPATQMQGFAEHLSEAEI
ncbi:MAG: c-type cytochrome [Alphaproteobacteria bacterium]|nr:c-type cytochrome [Alphaproteobacteria bacterium]